MECLVEISPASHGVVLDIAYATADNFTGRPVYARAGCYLHPAAAERLAMAAVGGAAGSRIPRRSPPRFAAFARSRRRSDAGRGGRYAARHGNPFRRLYAAVPSRRAAAARRGAAEPAAAARTDERGRLGFLRPRMVALSTVRTAALSAVER